MRQTFEELFFSKTGQLLKDVLQEKAKAGYTIQRTSHSLDISASTIKRYAKSYGIRFTIQKLGTNPWTIKSLSSKKTAKI